MLNAILKLRAYVNEQNKLIVENFNVFDEIFQNAVISLGMSTDKQRNTVTTGLWQDIYVKCHQKLY